MDSNNKISTAKGRQLGMGLRPVVMFLNESLKRRGTDISRLSESSVAILKEFIEEQE